MDNLIQQFFQHIKVGAKQSHKNMTLYCLLAAREADADFLTLDDALNERVLQVTEVDDAGEVPELKVRNRSDRKILVLDGEELVGAKQNRVLNVTILIAPESETVIPVSCVEQGRWSYRSREFGSARRAMSASMRKKKSETVAMSLEEEGSFRSDQGTVWAEIDAKYARMATPASPTMAMADLYEAHRETSEDYLKAFRPVDNQIGMVVFIDGEVAGVELLGKFESLKKNHSKLVHSYVMDALETLDAKKIKARSKASKARANKILESAGKAAVEKRKSVALGQDVRLESDEVVGAGLEFEGQVLQMTVFMKDHQGQAEETRRAMSRASRRRSSFLD